MASSFTGLQAIFSTVGVESSKSSFSNSLEVAFSQTKELTYPKVMIPIYLLCSNERKIEKATKPKTKNILTKAFTIFPHLLRNIITYPQAPPIQIPVATSDKTSNKTAVGPSEASPICYKAKLEVIPKQTMATKTSIVPDTIKV